MWVPSLGQEDPLEEEMATHSSILAWKISWTEEPGGLQSMGCKESDATEQLKEQWQKRRWGDLHPHQGVRSAGDPQGLSLKWGAGRQSRGTEQVACGVWSCLQVDCVRTQRGGRAPRGGRRGLHDAGGACTHVVSRSVRSTVLCVRSKNTENRLKGEFPCEGGKTGFFHKGFSQLWRQTC